MGNFNQRSAKYSCHFDMREREALRTFNDYTVVYLALMVYEVQSHQAADRNIVIAVNNSGKARTHNLND